MPATLLFIISFSRFFNLLCACGFLFGGLFFYKTRQVRLINLPFGIGVTLLLIILIGPLSKGDKVLKTIINADKIGLDSVKVCNLNRRVDTVLFDRAICVSDDLLLEKFTAALSTSTNPWFSNFKPPYDWGVLLELKLSNGEVIPFRCYKKN
ncbi:MAG: hypothetical protein AAF391_05440, partial [Bacteroidota bacterium]